jgi:ABC-type microcin C transport system permease subunit YejE
VLKKNIRRDGKRRFVSFCVFTNKITSVFLPVLKKNSRNRFVGTTTSPVSLLLLPNKKSCHLYYLLSFTESKQDQEAGTSTVPKTCPTAIDCFLTNLGGVYRQASSLIASLIASHRISHRASLITSLVASLIATSGRVNYLFDQFSLKVKNQPRE